MAPKQAATKGRKHPRQPRGIPEEAPVANPDSALVSSPPARSRSPTPQEDDAPQDTISSDLMERPISRVETIANPVYLNRLEVGNILFYERADANRFTPTRFYDINVTNLHAAMSATLTAYLQWKYFELGRLTTAQVTAEVAKIVPLTVDCCMSALYAKLRTIHKQYNTYATRYNAPPCYHKDLELPQPFADAIQNFGVFETHALRTNYVMVPTYPEGTRHEGRSTEVFAANDYETATTYLKMHGIPLKSVDTRLKFGTAWWTYKVTNHEGTYDLDCILPFSHYTNNSAILAQMFVNYDAAGAILPVVTLKNDDPFYGTKARELRLDSRYRAFSSLCQAPRVEWDYYARDI